MMVEYGFFSHETRHMLPLLPVLAWEGVLLLDRRLARQMDGPWRRGALLTLVVWLALRITPPGLGRRVGQRADGARAGADCRPGHPGPARPAAGTRVRRQHHRPWRLGRACVWSPYDEAIELEIRAAMPAMRDAPWVRLMSIDGREILGPPIEITDEAAVQ